MGKKKKSSRADSESSEEPQFVVGKWLRTAPPSSIQACSCALLAEVIKAARVKNGEWVRGLYESTRDGSTNDISHLQEYRVKVNTSHLRPSYSPLNSLCIYSGQTMTPQRIRESITLCDALSQVSNPIP